MSAKKYYWVKLKPDFYQDRAIKKLRKMPSGDTCVIIYQKLMLFALKSDGRLYFDGEEDNLAVQLALDIDEDENEVALTLTYLTKIGLLYEEAPNIYAFSRLDEMTGMETESAERVRRHRARQKAAELLPADGERYNVTESRDNVTPDRYNVQPRNENVTTDIEKIKSKSLDIDTREDKEKRGSGGETTAAPESEKNQALDAPLLPAGEQPPKPEFAPVPYSQVVQMYNNVCPAQGLPRAVGLSERRKKAIRARFAAGYTLESFAELFRITSESSFLRGQNDRNWMANFDWLIQDGNMAKVLSGNYSERPIPRAGSTGPAQKENYQPVTNNPFLRMLQAEQMKNGGGSYE